jgi:hypothetical protein
MYEQNQNVIHRPRHIFNANARNQGPSQDDQFVLEGRITDARGGGEVITARLDLGIVMLTFIATIPAEGTDTGPVYVKYAFRNILDFLRVFNPKISNKWYDPNYCPNHYVNDNDNSNPNNG